MLRVRSLFPDVRGLLLLGLLWLLGSARVAVGQFPERPNPPRLVNDFAQMLSADEVARLEAKLVAYDDSTSTQIAIVTVPTLSGYATADFAQQLGERWGIGNKGNDNGILILISKQERALNISTGYGMEDRVTDYRSSQLINQVLKPAFRQNQYYAGLDRATDALFQMAAGRYKAPAGYNSRNRPSSDGFPLWLIIVFVVVIVWLISRSGRGGGGRGYRSRGGGFFPPIILGGGGSGWSGGGGGGGGGFGGFGGGSFGGGGASGNW